MSFLLREGRPDDIASILAIDQEHSPVFAKASRYERLLDERGVLLVAEEAQGIIGFAACSMVLDEATLLNIAVLPQTRGRGVGKGLLREVMQRLFLAGAERLLLEVRESNQRAKSLYLAAGFTCDGERAHYYPRGNEDVPETAILMSRELGSDHAGT